MFNARQASEWRKWKLGSALVDARLNVKLARRLPEGERWRRDEVLAVALARLAEALAALRAPAVKQSAR